MTITRSGVNGHAAHRRPRGHAPRTPAEFHDTVASLMVDPQWLACLRTNVRECPGKAADTLRFMNRLEHLMRECASSPRVPEHIREDLLQSADDCAMACELILSASREIN